MAGRSNFLQHRKGKLFALGKWHYPSTVLPLQSFCPRETAWFHIELSGMVAFCLESWHLYSQELEKTQGWRDQTKICVVLKIGHCEMCLVTENTSLTQHTRVHQDHPGSNNDFSLLWHWYSKTVLHILILVVFTNLSSSTCVRLLEDATTGTGTAAPALGQPFHTLFQLGAEAPQLSQDWWNM